MMILLVSRALNVVSAVYYALTSVNFLLIVLTVLLRIFIHWEDTTITLSEDHSIDLLTNSAAAATATTAATDSSPPVSRPLATRPPVYGYTAE
jgi:hypothetical protein